MVSQLLLLYELSRPVIVMAVLSSSPVRKRARKCSTIGYRDTKWLPLKIVYSANAASST